jgi:sugar lactone lactonase YvrE
VEAVCVVDCRNVLGEGALWCPVEQRLWWIDISTPTLWSWQSRGGRVENWPLPKPPGSFALRTNGGFLFAFRNGLATLDAPGGVPRFLSGLELGDERFNDGKVDRAGRFWAGTLDRKLGSPIGRLYRIEAGPRVHPVDKGFTISNGIGWSPDGGTMYLADTVPRVIHAFSFDVERGTISDGRILATIADVGAGPDGLTVDAGGDVWVAVFGGGRVQRYSPEGVLRQELHVPASQTTSCAFAGPGLHRLYVTTATEDWSPRERRADPAAGLVYRFETDAVGRAAAAYRPDSAWWKAAIG